MCSEGCMGTLFTAAQLDSLNVAVGRLLKMNAVPECCWFKRSWCGQRGHA